MWLLGCDAVRSGRRAARFQMILIIPSSKMRWSGQVPLKRLYGSVNTVLHYRQQFS